MDVNEETILLNFLKSGLSTRKLDAILGFSMTKGWKSWEILKKYNLENKDKGKLFIYSENQSKRFIKVIINLRKPIADIIKENPPVNLNKYRNIFVIAKSEKCLYSAFSGETRNIIRDFFNPEKRLVSHCQFFNCNNKNIDTVHLASDRPKLFMEAALINKVKEGNCFRYNIYETMKRFLQEHARPKSVCFLCKSHHNEMHRLEKKDLIKLKLFIQKISFV